MHRKCYSDISNAFFFSLFKFFIVKIMTMEKNSKRHCQKEKGIVDI